MSIHPSLSPRGKGKRVRSVLKRFERLLRLQEKEKWKPGNSVFGLPKVKILRWKPKKEKKAQEAEAAAPAEGQAEGASGDKKSPAAKGGKPDKK